MRTLTSALIAVALAAAAVPAAAQTLSSQAAPASWKPLNQRQDDVAAAIANGVDRGALSDATAQGLRDQFKGLLNLEDTYRKTGLTPAQQADLQARYDTLEARIQVESHPASVQVRRGPAPRAGDEQ